MKKSRMFIVLGAMLISAFSSRARAVEYVGIGDAACPEFSIRQEIDTSHKTAYVAWMQGYLAALNYQAYKAGSPQRQIPWEPLLYEAVMTYCRRAGSLNSSLGTAAIELYSRLPVK